MNEKDERRFTPLHWAAHYGFLEVAETLLKAGAYSNIQDLLGFTPLTTAAQFNKIKAMELLLSHGADHKIKNKGMFYPKDCHQKIL